MSMLLRQTGILIRVNLLSLPRRLAISLSMALSIALVVCVLAGFLALAKGFERALAGAGSPRVAVVLGGGTQQESGSDIPAEAVRTLQATTDDIGVVRDAAGQLVASREIVVAVDVETAGDETVGDEAARTIAVRGMDRAGAAMRDQVALSAGRLFVPGAREIVVGDQLAATLGMTVGRSVRLGAVDWMVVGQFSAHGSAFESEIWADLDAVRAAFDRENAVQSLRLRLMDPAGLGRLQARLATVGTVPLSALSEADLYAAQSGHTTRLIRLFAWPLALLMAIGATAGALNTMMSSVSDRTVEIATVRALGFRRSAAFVGTWVEALCLAAVGVALGLVVSWLAFNGWQASTIGANNARLAFQLSVTPDVAVVAGLLGLAIGALGGLVPAFAATRLPLTAALRARG
ncbi:putative ABC transport system permease protein [Rhizobium sp. PP-F2F-G48]|uniref:ABC transporter permease n=1 Tax=Rhizobium sp. PP-F2F-G48 TaxID=2135651 RepID=UPI001053C1B4|nr:ABC transporter permease [Rhizobium sp. PP-F2F-G48]TCM58109.1 putative ABC transport system permease protein [Rhizobium sp. PP-F2F-G48]